MDGSLYEQIITLLTVPPGNLVYHLVLAFSVAGALPGALALRQGEGYEAGHRMVIGLCWLLAAQLLLILDAGLAQFFPLFKAWLPVLDRAVNAFSLVILGWLWLFPDSGSRPTYAVTILSLSALFLTLITGLWWVNQPGNQFFNGTSVDIIWTGFSLVLALAGGIFLIFRRPAGYGFGLAMLSLLFLGLAVYLFDPQPEGNFPGFIRLTQLAAYPLLLTLPARFAWAADRTSVSSPGLDRAAFENISKLAAESTNLEFCQAVTTLTTQALQAGLCLMISPPDQNQHISLHCGYSSSQAELLGPATFDSRLVPVISEALRQGRPLHLPAEGNIPDIVGLEKILNTTVAGSLLCAPIYSRSGEVDRALILFSAGSDQTWSAADQGFLADITASLAEIFDYKQQCLAQSGRLAESNTRLQHIIEENEQLTQESQESQAARLAADARVQALQTELEQALQELAAVKASRAHDKGGRV
jgi:hypothetical protein